MHTSESVPLSLRSRAFSLRSRSLAIIAARAASLSLSRSLSSLSFSRNRCIGPGLETVRGRRSDVLLAVLILVRGVVGEICEEVECGEAVVVYKEDVVDVFLSLSRREGTDEDCGIREVDGDVVKVFPVLDRRDVGNGWDVDCDMCKFLDVVAAVEGVGMPLFLVDIDADVVEENPLKFVTGPMIILSDKMKNTRGCKCTLHSRSARRCSCC